MSAIVAWITVTLMPTVSTLREALDVYVKMVSSEMVSHVLLSNLVGLDSDAREACVKVSQCAN